MPVRPPSPLVGRTTEVERLLTLLRDAANGEPRLGVVVGDSGVGKSRLLAEVFADDAPPLDSPVTVLRGRCAPVTGGGLPYACVVSALRPVLTGAIGEPSGAQALRRWPALQSLAPSTAPGADTAAAPSRTALFESVLALAGALAQQGPLVVVLDDVHWADPSTVDLVGHLACNLLHERVLLVLSLRPEALVQAHPLQRPLAELERLPLTHRVDLAPLGPQAVGELAAAVTGRPATDAELEAVVRRSGGVPFLVEELLNAGLVDGRGVPSTVRELLTAELGGAGEETRRLLAVAALAGREVDSELLAAVSGHPTDTVHELLRPAFERGLLVLEAEQDSIAFRHDLLREVAVTGMLPSERGRLHARLAAVIAEQHASRGLPSPEAELAYHHERGGQPREAVVASVRAAATARGMPAPGDVAVHLERVLRLWDEVEDAETIVGAGRGLLAREVAECRWSTGDPAAAARWAARAVDYLDGPDELHQRAVAAAYLGQYLFTAGERARAVTVLEAAETEARATPAAAAGRAAVLAVLAAVQTLSVQCRDALATCAEAIAAADDEAVVLHVRTTRATALQALGDVEAGLQEFEEVIELAGRRLPHTAGSGDLAGEVHDVGVVLARAINNYAYSLLAYGWPHRALALVERGLETVQRRRLGVGYRSHLAGLRALALVTLGRTTEARQALEELPRLPPSRMMTSTVQARISLAMLQGDRGPATSELVPVLEEIDILAPLAIELAASDGRLEDAAATAEDRVAWLQSRGVAMHGARIAALGVHAQAGLLARATREGTEDQRVRAVEGLRHLLAAARGFARQSAAGGQPPPEPAVWAELAEADAATALGGPEDAEALAAWRRAHQLAGDAELKPLALRASLGLTSALLAAGDRDAALVELRRTRDLATEMQAAPMLRELDELARRGRLDVRRGEHPGEARPTYGITERELEVLRGLVEGLTNQEIADRLFISAKTASVHVSNILRKLEVPHRRAAAARARELGLLAAPVAD